MTEEPTGSAPTSAPLFPVDTGASSTPPLDNGAPADPSAAPRSVSPQPADPAGAPPEPEGLTPQQKAAWEALPKSWKKDMEPHWAGMSPEAKQYAHTREEQVLKGFQQYASGHENWSKVVEPFREVLSQNPNVDAAETFRTLGQNHLLLTNSPMPQKIELARNLLAHYGITPEMLGGAPGGAPSDPAGEMQPFTPEQMRYLHSIMGPVAGQLQDATKFVQDQRLAENIKVVDAFFSDPQNEFVEEVGQDMFELLQKGKAENLSDAYELAIMRNAEVKAKYIAKLASKQQNSSPTPQVNIKSSNAPATPPKPATMDESFDSVLKKHYG